MNNTSRFFHSICLIQFFILSVAHDKSSLGQLAILPNEIIQEVAVQLIKTIGTPAITNHADVPVIAKNIKNFSLVNKYLYNFLNTKNNTGEFTKSLAGRFKYSFSKAACCLNTPGTRSSLFEYLKTTGEYDAFLAVHAFHQALQQQHSEITNLVTFDISCRPTRKIQLSLSFNQRYLSTPWGEVNLFSSENHHLSYPNKYNLRSKGKSGFIKNNIETLFISHCKKFDQSDTRNSFDNTNFAWKLMLLQTPELREKYLPSIIQEKEKEVRRRIPLPCVEGLPQWALTVFQQFDHPMYDPDVNSMYLSLNKSAINTIFYFLHFYAKKTQLNYKCMIRSRTDGFRLYNNKSLNLGSICAAYVTTTEHIQNGWTWLPLADNMHYLSSIKNFSYDTTDKIFSEEERFLIIKESEFSAYLADLIRNLADYYGLNNCLSVDVAAQPSLKRKRLNFIYCWIEKNSFPEIYEKFGFKIKNLPN
jgi:phosphopantetheinyl transferase (holo-ACP synthase)